MILQRIHAADLVYSFEGHWRYLRECAAGDTSNCGFQDLRNLRAERSLDNIDVPHRFVLSGVYELPFGKGHHFGSGMRLS